MGHALNASIQDLLIRYHRMRGFSTLWQPGYDHAGIATQNVVERELAKEGLTPTRPRPRGVRRADVGVARALRRRSSTASSAGSAPRSTTGASASRWTRATCARSSSTSSTSTTAGSSTATTASSTGARAARARSPTSRSNHTDEDDTLYTIRYPLADGSGHVTIATVRPPTMLADVAVAVHPDDERYRDLVGKEAIVPVAERRVPIIADERVDPEFGTGAVKVTPGHDPMDFEIGRTHGLARAHGHRARRAHERGGGRVRRPRRRRRPRSGSSRASRSAACSSRPSRTGTRSATATAAARGSSR